MTKRNLVEPWGIISSSISSLLRVSEADEVPINSHIWVTSIDDIQTALKLLEKYPKKYKYIFITNLAIAESFQTINRPDRIAL